MILELNLSMRIKSMNKKYIEKEYKKRGDGNGGFVLLAAVIFLSIALGTGVFIGARILRSTSRVIRTDTASKVYSGAEGGAESFIVLPDSYLDQFLSATADPNDSNLCPKYGWVGYTDPIDGLHGCEVSYIDPETGVETVAKVTINSYKSTSQVNGSEGLTFYLDEGNTQEIVISRGGTSHRAAMDVCWDNDDVQLYMISYNEDGIIDRQILYSENISPSGYDSLFETNLVKADWDNSGNFANCYEMPSSFFSNHDPAGVRIRALRGSTNIGAVPENFGNFPIQGFLIKSKAELKTEGITKSVKTVRVFKSVSFLPNIFDYAIYSEGQIVN
jgi:hypothetical protein